MNSFIQYVLWELKNSMVLVILACALGLGILLGALMVHKKRYGKGKAFPWGKAFCWLALAGYLAVVVYATVVRHSGGFRQWNFHLFRAWREAWNQFSVKLWANVLLNVAMFVPMGILPQLLGKWPRKWYFGIGLGFAVSLAIELLQLATARGICDVDDLFANTLGTAIGYFAVMTLLSLLGEKGKRLKSALLYGCLTLLPLIAIGSIFVAYHAKEYGNLPEAASYTNNTESVEWNLACDLSAKKSTAAVYRTQSMNKAACDAFAEEIAALAGREVLMGSYFEEMAYYNLSRGILSVNYYDGSYDLWLSDNDIDQWQEVSRETAQKALAAYPIVIPETAVFSAEKDGWCRFTCERYLDGAVLIDGILRMRCDGNGVLYEIENSLVWYTHYKDVAVISPCDAYALLCAGKFGDGGFFEYVKPGDIMVLSWKLDYKTDTKGFYQPVYLFEVASKDGDYRDWIMIPAMQ